MTRCSRCTSTQSTYGWRRSDGGEQLCDRCWVGYLRRARPTPHYPALRVTVEDVISECQAADVTDATAVKRLAARMALVSSVMRGELT